MAYRVAASRSSAVLAAAAASRPAIAAPRLAAAVAASSSVRTYADKPSPESRASALLDVLPGNSLVSKTGWVTLGTGLSAVAISNELYVVNEETVILAGFLIFATLLGRSLVAPYTQWADSQIEKISGILNASRKEHTDAVAARIDSVSAQKDVAALTTELFAVAKETAKTEQEVFELQQRTKLAAELKAVLDSWVRFEGQQREEEQRALAGAIVKKVADALKDDKLQKQILEGAIADVEQLVKAKTI
ncbi:atp4 subunit B of the stator stalk of mitochondrial F1F0 ATP synthase [Tilletia horrida]|uniref:ATP synthase subunit 4 n=1 Tax=Tilletia horrida TaxID=155126 RepID=A0AAN6GAG7_9BASI|nr:atp4 subunit B of the stator stalk of mitochondrial F1F0 ATP synthase [Tilletia horrida]KAK0531348.1 atp4 subunit B of the stator stalk of mitochondrial F1F0 ATP synthase [Tilletia horrida]KAK0534116.1 atp4 subunit B of the stator stalk of mitochondrial F1F0 ATP synthase [Tilletia horrida]KAK0561955.1 atp4 subunit B of the stator stalk of mitochondrial F1F0 ATP synthase [Tilletia horrida]